MQKYLVLYRAMNNSVFTKTKQFDNIDLANSFIESKVKRGVTCHLYNYDSSFTLTSTVNKTKD